MVITISNFICMLFVARGQNILVFKDTTFKITAWWPYWIFQFPDTKFNLVFEHQIQTSVAYYLCVWEDRIPVIVNNVQLQSTRCPLLRLLMCGDILVDHWSTIPSCVSSHKLFDFRSGTILWVTIVSIYSVNTRFGKVFGMLQFFLPSWLNVGLLMANEWLRYVINRHNLVN